MKRKIEECICDFCEKKVEVKEEEKLDWYSLNLLQITLPNHKLVKMEEKDYCSPECYLNDVLSECKIKDLVSNKEPEVQPKQQFQPESQSYLVNQNQFQQHMTNEQFEPFMDNQQPQMNNNQQPFMERVEQPNTLENDNKNKKGNNKFMSFIGLGKK